MKLFLSRDRAGDALTGYTSEAGHELIAFSCIEQKLIGDDPPPSAEWIFFYSPSAAELFMETFRGYRAKTAVLGKGTSRVFEGKGIKPDFVGKSSDPSEVMREFKQVMGEKERVIQARGEKSFERLREVLPDERIIDWPFYQSVVKTEIPKVEADVYIFTSPSNAEAYLSKYELGSKSTVIVFGQSTKKAVEKYTNAEVLTTEEPGEAGIVRKIRELRNGLQ